MRKRFLFYTVISASMLAFSGCAANSTTNSQPASAVESSVESTAESMESSDESTAEDTANASSDEADEDADAIEIKLDEQKTDLSITKGGSYRLTGKSEGISVLVNTEDEVKLILDNASMENENGPCIYIENAKKTKLRLVGTSTISDTREELDEEEELNAAILSKEKLILSGDGTLKLETKSAKGIKSSDELTIKSGTYQITAADDAIRAKKALTIEDGDIVITSETEGIESKDGITIEGGKLSIMAADDGINAANSIVINGGDLKVISTGNDAIDSNGTLEINGGYVEAYGLSTPEGAYDNDSGTFAINGGTVVGLGSANSFPNSGEQKTLMLAPDTEDAIQTVEIRQNGKSLLTVNFDDYSEYKSQHMPDFAPGEDGGNMPQFEGDTNENAGKMPAPPSINGETVNEEEAEKFFQNLDQQGGRPGFGGGERPAFGGPKGGPQSDSQDGTQSDSQDGQTGEQQGGFGRFDGFGRPGGFGSMDSVNIFLSVPGLEDGSAEIYINGELWQEAEISELVTSLGNVNTMFAGGFGGQGGKPGETQK